MHGVSTCPPPHPALRATLSRLAGEGLKGASCLAGEGFSAEAARTMPLRPILLTLALLPLTACGNGTMDMSGYPDASRERLYRDGRLGGDDNGLLSFDARKAWRAVDGNGQ